MKYEKYKDSGVEWIDEVPVHWEVRPLKSIGQLNKGVTFTKADIVEEGVPAISYGQIHAKNNTCTHLHKELIRYIPDYFVKGATISKVAKGDFIFADTSEDYEGCGNCIYIDTDYSLYGGYHTIVYKTKTQENKFLAYLFKTDCWRYQIRSRVSGVKVFSITQSIISSCSIVLPPLSEQQVISSYLDEKCNRIDKAIDVQKKKIDLLNELKQTIITDAVTKGLDPNIPMKDSGVQWIGKIPKHWKIKRTRFLCKIQTGDKDTVNRIDDGQYPFYVRSPKVERIDSYSFDGEAVLMAGDGVGAGKVFHYANGKFDYHQRVYNLHNFKDVSGMYYFYYISNKFKYIIEEGAAKNTVDSVRLNMIQDFWVTIPPLSEQQIIVAHIEKETTKIDSQITKANRRIELLEELKQSIITEAVTGKIKVC